MWKIIYGLGTPKQGQEDPFKGIDKEEEKKENKKEYKEEEKKDEKEEEKKEEKAMEEIEEIDNKEPITK